MTDYGTIKVPRDVYERHNQRRKETNMTWGEYLEQEAPNSDPHGDVNTEQVLRKLDDLESRLPRKVARELR